MKKISLLVLVFSAIFSISFAQQMQGNMPPQGARPAIGSVTGKIYDKETKELLPYAVIEVISVRENKTVAGAVSDDKGAFNITQIPVGKMTLKVSFVGYNVSTTEPFLLLPNAPTKNFDSILLTRNQNQLRQAQITAEKQMLVQNLDKRVFNNDRNLVSAGGTGNDVLRQVPGVNVDIDGKISLRGNENVTILIDGRPSSILGSDKKSVLSSIPAASIESIEVITNPSAKYAAEGMSGIINIVMKKNKLQGFNGQVTASAGTIDKYTGGLNMSYRNKKWNFYGSYMGKDEHRRGSGSSYRETNQFDSTYYMLQSASMPSENKNHLLGAGAEYSLDKYTTFGTRVNLNLENEIQPENIVYRYLNEDSIYTNSIFRFNDQNNKNQNGDINFSLRKKFPTPKEELSADLTISNMSRDGRQDYIQEDSLLSIFAHSGIRSKAQVQMINAQVDYTVPNGEFGKYELGGRIVRRHSDADYLGLLYPSTSMEGAYINQDISNHFVFTEQISAAYLTKSGIFKSFAYQLGLRGEYTLQDIFLTNNSFFQKNRYFNFFPTAIIRQPLSKKDQIQLSYSRRINRPNPQSQNPFLDISDPQNKRQGNPGLKPELVHSIELGYQRSLEKYSINASLYYRHSNNLQIRYRSVLPDGTSLISFLNAYSSDNYGLEATGNMTFSKKWDAMLNLNVYESKINAANIEADLQNNFLSWSGRFNTNYRITKFSALQASINYQAPMVIAQGKFASTLVISGGWKNDLFKNRLNLTLSVMDALSQMRMDMTTSGPNFKQHSIRRRDRGIVMLTAIYRFGAMSNEMAGKRPSRGRMEGGPSMDDM
ncbi:MAG: TonB-dependent receptor [Chitinophagales bacterium]|nr:TonB-dependent receptor [Chitinophagales bacterium]